MSKFHQAEFARFLIRARINDAAASTLGLDSACSQVLFPLATWGKLGQLEPVRARISLRAEHYGKILP